MNIINITLQKGAALLSRICAMLEPFCLWVGSKPGCGVKNGSSVVSVSCVVKQKRYAVVELMKGITPEKMEALNAEAAWALEGEAVGEELT